MYERNKRDDGKYHGVFAYTVPESYEMSFDDEDNKIELTLKVKWNSAEGTEANLPPEWFAQQAHLPSNMKVLLKSWFI